MEGTQGYTIAPIGWVRSTLKERTNAPRQGSEGAPDARLEVAEGFAQGLEGIGVGDEILVLTWFHQSRREV
jgi:tRNA (Thr-GGU) A37 N-methylase